MLSASSNYADALACTARLAVPTLADWCFVDVIRGEGGDEAFIHRSVVAHTEHTRAAEELAKKLQYHYPLNSGEPYGTPSVLRTGQPEMLVEMTNEMLEAIARDGEHLAILRDLGPKSYMCVPLRVRQKLIGSVGFVVTESRRRYDEKDLSMAEGLAYCAALTIDYMLHSLSETNTVRESIRVVRDSQASVVSAIQEGAPQLTLRQLEVLKLISYGKSAKVITLELGLSESTIRGHIRSILRAFGAHSQLEALAKARKLGFLTSRHGVAGN